MTNNFPIPNKPPLKLLSPPEIQPIGTQFELSFMYAVGRDEMKEFKTSANA